MAYYYNKLSEISLPAPLTSWRFRVKILRVYPYDVYGDQYWCYVIADEDGTKTSLVIFPSEVKRYLGYKDANGQWVDRRLQDQEGKWIEIFRVNVESVFTGFKPVDSPFRLTVFDGTRIKPIEPINNRHYLDFTSFDQISSADWDLPINLMGVVKEMKPLKVRYGDPERTELVFTLRDPMLVNRKYEDKISKLKIRQREVKCIAKGDTAHAFNDAYSKTRGMGVVVVVLRMWRIYRYLFGGERPWLETHNRLSDFRFNPEIKEVDDFRRELEASDFALARQGNIVIN